MKEIYSIWGIPSAPTYRNVESVITRLAHENGGPTFSPHITVVGDVGLPKSQLIDAIGSLNTDSDKTFRLGRVACSENYYKAVFVETRDDRSLRTLRANLLALLFMGSEEYSPHMSLIYGTFAKAVLATIASSITIPDMPTKIARLNLVLITQDPNEWESIYSLFLMPNQQD